MRGLPFFQLRYMQAHTVTIEKLTIKIFKIKLLTSNPSTSSEGPLLSLSPRGWGSEGSSCSLCLIRILRASNLFSSATLSPEGPRSESPLPFLCGVAYTPQGNSMKGEQQRNNINDQFRTYMVNRPSPIFEIWIVALSVFLPQTCESRFNNIPDNPIPWVAASMWPT